MKKEFLKISILSVLVLVGNIATLPTVFAADKTVHEAGISITENNIEEFNMDYNSLQTNIPFASSDCDDTGNCTPTLNKTYTSTYPNSLNWYGKMLTVKVDVKWISVVDGYELTNYGNRDNRISYDSKKRIRMVASSPSNELANQGQYTKVEIKTSFYDEARKEFPFTGVFGFRDPDLSNYLFDTNNREIYYIHADKTQTDRECLEMEDAYVITNNGLERTEAWGSGCYFQNGLFGVSLNQESSFTFVIAANNGDIITVPFLYSITKEYNITYILNGGTNSTSNPSTYTSGDEITIKNPTREGYKFLGWKEGNKIETWDFGAKTFTAEWEQNVVTEVEVGDTGMNVSDTVYIMGIICIIIGAILSSSVLKKQRKL